MNRARKIKRIAGGRAVISVVHARYLFPVRTSVTRERVSRASFFPILPAGPWFGLRGGVPAPVIVSLLCVKSAPGKGTRLTLWFPISGETPSSDAAVKTAIQSAQEVADFRVPVGSERESLRGDREKPIPIF